MSSSRYTGPSTVCEQVNRSILYFLVSFFSRSRSSARRRGALDAFPRRKREIERRAFLSDKFSGAGRRGAAVTAAVRRPEPGYLIPMNEYPVSTMRSLTPPLLVPQKEPPVRSVLPRDEPTPSPWLRVTFNGRAVAYVPASRRMRRRREERNRSADRGLEIQAEREGCN